MMQLGQTDIPHWLFWLGTVVLFLIIAAIIWFAIPGIDAKHRFVSPSGEIAVTVGEQCNETGCQRVIFYDETVPGSSAARFNCDVPVADLRPVLLNAYPLWAPDESSVDIVYADSEGVGGKFTVLLSDCAPLT